jgi:outer membrane protein assembly factor BamB
MPTPADAPVIADDGTIYAGSEGGTLVALSPDGDELWTAKVNDNIHSPSIGEDGTLYCGGAPLVLYAFSPDGRQLWDMWPEGELPSYDEMYPCVNCVQSPSIAADGTLFAGSQVMPGIDKTGAQIADYRIPESGSLYAISPDGRKLLWSHTRKSFATMTPTIAADGTLYAGTSAFKVIALRQDGAVLWEFQTATNDCPFVYSPPIGKDGLLYAATSSGKLYCITPQGKQKWLYDSGRPWLSNHNSNNLTPPCIAEDGTLYTAQFDGTVLAFE